MKMPQTDGEILEFAIWKEYQAGRLFKALASRMTNPELAALLEELAAEEFAHKEKLELEMMKTGRTVSVEPSPDDAELLVANVSEISMEITDILALAIQKEEASFRLYVSLFGQVQEEQSKEVLLALAQEEVRHKIRFETELEKLTSH